MMEQKNNTNPRDCMIFDKNTEMSVLGALMNVSLAAFQEVRHEISREMFYIDNHQKVLDAICNLVDRGEELSLISVSAEFAKIVGDCTTANTITMEMYGMGCSVTQIPQYLAILKGYDARRKMWLLGHQLIANGSSASGDLMSELEQAKATLEEIQTGGHATFKTLTDALHDVTQIVNDNLNGNKRNGTPTGYTFIDERGGLQPGNLIVIAGASSMGKTAFAGSIVSHAIKHDGRIAFYTMEMTTYQMTARLLSAETKLKANRILTDKLTTEDLPKYDKGVAVLEAPGQNLFFDDKTDITIDALISSMMRLKAQRNIDGAVIDFLQLLGGQDRNINKEQFMARCARRLKNVAKQLNIWVVALSQLNRDKDNPIPSLDRLRDSGQIAEAADIVMMVYRPQYYIDTYCKNLAYPSPFENVDTNGTAMIMVEKGRNIGTGKFICGFSPETTSFYPLQQLPIRNNSRNGEILMPWE